MRVRLIIDADCEDAEVATGIVASVLEQISPERCNIQWGDGPLRVTTMPGIPDWAKREETDANGT